MQKQMSKRQLISCLNIGTSKLDVNMTANYVGEFGCADVFGTKFTGNNSEDLLGNLSKLGIDIGEVSYQEPFWYIGESVEEYVESVVQEAVVSVPDVPIVETEVTNETETPDLEWVSTLKNNKEDKAKLDVYAEKFNVKLNQRNTLKNMVSDFKKKYSA